MAITVVLLCFVYQFRAFIHGAIKSLGCHDVIPRMRIIICHTMWGPQPRDVNVGF